MTSVAVVGPGAIGATVAAWLAQDAGFDLTVCARTPFEGLQVETPERRLTASPRVITRPGDARPVDWVLIAAKAYDAESVAAWLPSLLQADSRVAVLQNGVEHVARFAPYVDATRITPVIVDIPAERDAPGRLRQRGRGTLIVPIGAAGEDFVRLFAGTDLDASVTPDFTTAAWRKLCLNCAGAVSALTLQPAGVARLQPIAELMRAMIREAVQVGRAQGAVLEDALAEEIVDRYRAGPADAVNSMLADRRAGRPMEVDARNGVIVRLGGAARIETPVNAMVAALLDATAFTTTDP